jgi:hypothetical protein
MMAENEMRIFLRPGTGVCAVMLLATTPAASLSNTIKDTAMNEQRRVLTLESQTRDGTAELIVFAQSNTPVAVRYELVVEGDSVTRHAGATRVLPGDQHMLSRVRVTSKSSWCASLKVHQDDGMDYRLSEGSCYGNAH